MATTNKLAGKQLILRRYIGATPDIVASIKVVKFIIDGEQIDITTQGDSWFQSIAGGQINVQIQASGIFKDASYETAMKVDQRSFTPRRFTLSDGASTPNVLDCACWFISDYERQMDANDVVKFNFTLLSSDTVTWA